MRLFVFVFVYFAYSSEMHHKSTTTVVNAYTYTESTQLGPDTVYNFLRSLTFLVQKS